jgi:hypothetical protein
MPCLYEKGPALASGGLARQNSREKCKRSQHRKKTLTRTNDFQKRMVWVEPMSIFEKFLPKKSTSEGV